MSAAPTERALTAGPLRKDLDNNANFSPDGRLLVFDCRGEGGINTNDRLGVVDVASGDVEVFYRQPFGVLGVGAPSFLTEREVVAIHAIPGLTYDFTVRGGRILPLSGGPGRWLDSRDARPPFTAGALRGGTHKHEPDGTGRWVGFTYNDHVMKVTRGSDLRNVGVSLRGHPVPVDPDAAAGAFAGESFSVLLTACVDHPTPGSDELQRAEGDCWVGREGYSVGRRRRRARAFRGTVAVEENGRVATYGEVFVVDVPDDPTVPGPLGPLEGTATEYPKPPKGARVRRLTRTAEHPNPALRGVTGHLRASGDGRWIAFVGRAQRHDAVESQLFVVSAATGEVRPLSHEPGGVVGDPRFSPDSRYVAAARPDGSVWAWSADRRSWGRALPVAPAAAGLASNIVISPDSRLIAYNRPVHGTLQVLTCEGPR